MTKVLKQKQEMNIIFEIHKNLFISFMYKVFDFIFADTNADDVFIY